MSHGTAIFNNDFYGGQEACCLSALSLGIANSQEGRGVNMDATSKVDPKQFAESMKFETDSYLESVIQIVDSALDGE